MTGARGPVFVTATAHAQPGSADALVALAGELVNPNRAKPGCLYYALHVTHDDPDLLLMYELFASGKAFSEHMRSAHVLGFLAAPAELTLEPLAVRAWRNIGPLPPLQDPRRHKRTARNTGAAARQEHSMTDSDPTRSSPARVQLPRPLRHRRQDRSRIPEPSATTSLRERPE